MSYVYRKKIDTSLISARKDSIILIQCHYTNIKAQYILFSDVHCFTSLLA